MYGPFHLALYLCRPGHYLYLCGLFHGFHDAARLVFSDTAILQRSSDCFRYCVYTSGCLGVSPTLEHFCYLGSSACPSVFFRLRLA